MTSLRIKNEIMSEMSDMISQNFLAHLKIISFTAKIDLARRLKYYDATITIQQHIYTSYVQEVLW